jgi:hypothetical protein
MKGRDAEPPWLAQLRAAWFKTDLHEPPASALERARQLFQTRSREPRRGPLERLRASLIFDSRRRPAVAGVRAGFGDFGAGPWQLLYRGGDIDIDLLVRPNQDGRTAHVRGQALSLGGLDLGGGVVEATPSAHPDESPTATSELLASGEFALVNIVRGHYDVLLRLSSRDIELSNVEL